MASITEKAKEAKEAVKESLLGVEYEQADQQTSAQTRAEFMQHAIKDEQTGEYCMGQKEFVNAVAPPDEDYVRTAFLLSCLHPSTAQARVRRSVV